MLGGLFSGVPRIPLVSASASFPLPLAGVGTDTRAGCGDEVDDGGGEGQCQGEGEIPALKDALRRALLEIVRLRGVEGYCKGD